MLAARTDRLAIIRSMTHDDPAHLSTAPPGPHRSPGPDALSPTPAGPSPNDWPHLGALVGRLRPGAGQGAMPACRDDALDRRPPRRARRPAPGQNGGWLGKAFDPFRVGRRPQRRPASGSTGSTLPEGVDPDAIRRPPQLCWLAAAVCGSSGAGAPAWDTFQARRSTRSASAAARGAFDVDARTRGSATATAGTSTASACSWPVG